MAPDAIVVGAGICGAAAAFYLQESGLDVLLLERDGICAGSTGRGEGNVLVCDKPAGVERELAVQARELWIELGERFPAARVTQKGALVIDHERSDGPGAQPPGVPPEDLALLEPGLAAGVRAVREPGDLQVDAVGLTRALAATVPVREDAHVIGVQPGEVTLGTGERLACEHVIVATGAWATELTGLPVRPRKGQLVALAAPPQMIRHKLIEASYRELAGDRTPELGIASVIEQTLDGDEVLVGSSRELTGFDVTVRDEVTNAMIKRAARFVPALLELPIRRAWCGFRPWLPDGLPAVGALRQRLWTSTGHEGSGVCLGPISGLLLAEMITGAQPLRDPTPFDPRRFGRTACATNM